mgnify:CR=1 FL=1
MEEIKRKGFNMTVADSTPDVFDLREVHDFSKIKVGIKQLTDAVIDVGSYKKINPRCGDKETVLKAVSNCDLAALREISNFFYKTSGIYNRLCRYMAYLYRYDWFITPYINGGIDVANREEEETLTSAQRDKILTHFFGLLKFLDEFEVKRFCGEVALKVIKNGCYYGYIIPNSTTVAVQELPPAYCRSRFSVNNRPAVEFNMSFFDKMYPDSEMRAKVLNLFPPEFKKGYKAYKDGKLKPTFSGDTSGWYLLDTRSVIKFNLNGEDFPPLISVIPAIIDLDEAQDLDRRRMAQKLLRIIIQKMPIDKNGDLVFDIDEAQALHNNAVRMLSRAIGIDVLTTFADVDVADMADRNTTTTVDDLSKIERTVFNEAGVSQMQFNTDGNIALEKSILNDEASMWNLIQQFETFLNTLLIPYNKSPKKVTYRAQILPTTIYNYKDLAKQYKEHTQLGYSKMLPQIALGQAQSAILNTAYFENDILDLVNVFIPPLMSSTMNAEVLNRNSSDSNAGRPEKSDDEKSTKTIQNR